MTNLNEKLYIILLIVVTLMDYSVETESEYEYFPDTDSKPQEIDVEEQRWAVIDNEIAAKEEEYNRRRRQIFMISRPSTENKPVVRGERNNNLCPSKCICQVPEQVHCTFKFLTEIPAQLPKNIEKLNIGFNKITAFTSNSIEKHNKTLRHFYLHSNDIRSLGNNGFMQMSEIEVLRLSWNKITGIRKTALQGLTKVERVYLDNNRLTFIHPLALRGLVNLKLLQLSGNRLSRLHQNVFVTLHFQKYFWYSSIRYLYLAENRFKNLHRHIFDNLQQLKYVYLHGNSWDCTCETKWMKIWMENTRKYRCKSTAQKARSSGIECPMCHYPVPLQGKRIINVPNENFLCEAPKLNSRNDSDSVYNYDMEYIDFDNEKALFRYSDFYTARMNIRLDSNRRSVLHATCNFTNIPVTNVTSHASGTYYTAFFEASIQCFIEYPEELTVLRNILYPYFDREMQLSLLQKNKNKYNGNQQQYSVSVNDSNGNDKLQLTEACVDSSTKFLRSPTSWITFQSSSVDPIERSVSATFKTSFKHIHSPIVKMESKRQWALIKQPDPTRVDVVIALERTTTAIKCKAVGQPKVEFNWVTPSGQAIKSGTKTGKYSVSRSGRLVIRRTENSDSGFYRCIATVPETAKPNSTRFRSSAVAEISVLRLEIFAKTSDAVSLLATSAREVEMQTVDEGDNWLSRCSVQGFPIGTQGWITPKNELVLNTRKIRGVSVNSNGKITISNFTKSNQGLYRCVTANIAGRMDRFIYVGIRSNDDQFMQTIHQIDLQSGNGIHQGAGSGATPTPNQISNSENVDIVHISSDVIGHDIITDTGTRKPYFDSETTTSYVVTPGTSVSLDCKARGTPDPNYVWYLSNNTIESAIVNGKIILTGSTLVIKSAEKEFAGAYRCVAENSAGSVEKTVQLIIDKPAATGTKFPGNLTDFDQIKSFNLSKTKALDDVPDEGGISDNFDGANSTDKKTEVANAKKHKVRGQDHVPSVETVFDEAKYDTYINSKMDEPEIHSSKYTKFLSTPASYDNIPVVVRSRTRANRKEAFSLKPSTTEAPSRQLNSDDTLHQFTNVIKPTLFTKLRHSHAKKVLSTLSSDEKTVNSKTNPTKPTTLNSFDVDVSTVIPIVKIAKEMEQINITSLKARSFSLPNRPLSSSPASLMLAAFVNKTIRTVNVSSFKNESESPTVEIPTTTSHLKTIRTVNVSSFKNESESPTVEIPTTTSRRPAQRYRMRPTYNNRLHRYELPGKITRSIFQSRLTVFKNHGENAVLPCISSSRDYIPMHRWTFAWYLPLGKTLRRPQRISSLDYRQFIHINGSLFLKNLKAEDSGMYSCMGSERGHGVSAEYRSRITLYVRSQPPRILNSLRGYVDVPSGDSAIIPCETVGSPKPTVTWRLPKGRTIEAGKWIGGIIVYGNGTLDLSNIRPDDEGYYTCTATNDVGTVVRNVYVRVTSYSPRIFGSRHSVVRVQTLENAKLVCPVIGNPKPKFSWLSPNDEEIQENHAIFKGNTHQAKYAGMQGGVLYVNDAHREDSGMYHCIATNAYGQLVFSVRLVVFP